MQGRKAVESGELDDLIFDLYQLSAMDRQRIRATATDTITRFQSSANAPQVSSEAKERYLATLRMALSSLLPSLYVTPTSRQQGSYLAVSLKLSTTSTRRHVDSGPVDIERIVESLAQRSPHTSGIVAQPGGLFLDEDTVFIIKTLEADRWTFDVALDDADYILTVLTRGK